MYLDFDFVADLQDGEHQAIHRSECVTQLDFDWAGNFNLFIEPGGVFHWTHHKVLRYAIFRLELVG